MITIQKIKIYKKYNGDGDAFVRFYKKKKYDMSYDDWKTIESFVHDIKLIKRGFVAQEYKEKIIKKMRIELDDDSFNIIWDMIS